MNNCLTHTTANLSDIKDTNKSDMRAVVLCFSGLDPSGGAGLQADIEAIGASGAHATIACTAITIQDSQNVFGFKTLERIEVSNQALAVLNDLPVKAIKSGMLGSVDNIELIAELFETEVIAKNTPYVLDPVLVANSGDSLGDEKVLIRAFNRLLPHATLVTPNTHELRALSGVEDLHEGAKILCSKGAHAVLVKTAHDHIHQDIDHYLYVQQEMVYHSVSKRLQGEFHGSGCTLASYIAGRLAQCTSAKHTKYLIDAVKAADKWIHQTLVAADVPHPDNTGAQRIPNRFTT